MDPAHETSIRVRFADTDADGGVFDANYITYFSICRHEFLRETGLRKLQREENLRMAVVEVNCRYHAIARFDDVLTVRLSPKTPGNRSFIFAYEIVRKENEGTETLIATGGTTSVYLARSGGSVPIPDSIRKILSD